MVNPRLLVTLVWLDSDQYDWTRKIFRWLLLDKNDSGTSLLMSLLLQAAVVQINEGLYFRSPKLATGLISSASNIA